MKNRILHHVPLAVTAYMHELYNKDDLFYSAKQHIDTTDIYVTCSREPDYILPRNNNPFTVTPL